MAYTIWRIRIKGHKLNKVLSVRSRAPYRDSELINYMYQHAVDNQVNPNSLTVEQFAEIVND